MFTEIRAKELIKRFSKKQQGGHFACPRCGKMAIYICDSCGTEEVIEDMGALPKLPLRGWAIAQAPELWRCE